ncbi:MAG: GYD domain-containing protein [Candidatus Limnocylindrales bacterium]
MGKYLYRLRYTQTGLEGTIKEGFVARETFFRERVASLGGTTESAYWAYGEDDALIVADLPDTATATGLSLALARTGSFQVATTVLLTAAEMDAGAAKAPTYRAPGS